eukprot:TRINITY_DN2074_c5_g1_i1.p1 TRINITY_DN2074_c5_g1~~TRINITY_DN2074_c5_g1_i1.p1  ORF type:complete len:105 (+),score=26.12 TRINITY_DN2074_c5_g1_i1:23-316(+)
MSQASRAIAAEQHDAFRAANHAKEAQAEAVSSAHIVMANDKGDLINSEISRLATEVGIQGTNRVNREAVFAANAHSPYRYQDATWNHAPTPKYMSYY